MDVKYLKFLSDKPNVITGRRNENGVFEFYPQFPPLTVDAVWLPYIAFPTSQGYEV